MARMWPGSNHPLGAAYDGAGTNFSIFSEIAERIELCLFDEQGNETRVDLPEVTSFCWHGYFPNLGPGQRYGFRVHGPWKPEEGHRCNPAKLLLDPYARTIEGQVQWNEAVFAHFFSNPDGPPNDMDSAPFVPKSVVINPYFDWANDRHPRTPITHVELMPVAEFSGSRGWGYDGVYPYAPHHAYGEPDDLKRLVDACHARGLAIVLDVVYNHLGPAGNYLDRFGPYFTDRYTTPWGAAVNFDGPFSDEVRRFFCDNALMWLRDYHFDGLRLDAVHAILDTSATHFLEQLACEVADLEAQVGRHQSLIAESNRNDPRIVRPPELGGYGNDAQWSDDFHHALHCVLTGERNGYYIDFASLADLAKALRQVFVYDGRYSVFRKRRHGRRPVELSGHRFLGYLQNHDQIGNRAKGERSSHLMGLGRLKIGAALVLTGPLVPLLFQGEEWGSSSPFLYFTDHEDPELARAVIEGRRREFVAFGWRPEDVPNPQAIETFERSKLNWSEQNKEPHSGLLAWHRRLIQLRREIPALSDGRLDRVLTNFDESAKWLVVRRGPAVIACNLSDIAQRVPVDLGHGTELLLASENNVQFTHNAVTLPLDSVAILISAEPHQ
jgi:maltooligosyltrehalose trehalohydrolase